MNQGTEINIITTKPSLKTIGFGLLGTLFFGAFAYLILFSEWTVDKGTDYNTGITIIWIVLGGFIFFSVSCLITVLRLKIIILTNHNLIIKRPLLFLKIIIPLGNIKKIRDEVYKIDSSHGGSSFNVYNGHKMILDFYDGKKRSINSFEISDYYALNQKLKNIKRQNKNIENDNYDYSNKLEGYGWLLFVLILTIGFIYSLIKQKN
jgi:hypothetical protein